MQTIAHIMMLVLETAFFVGLAGSVVVVVISFIEDFAVLVEKDKK